MRSYWDRNDAASGVTAILAGPASGEDPQMSPVGNRPGSAVHRGHLLAKDFGGDGQAHNIVAMFAYTNLSGMALAENAVRRSLAGCDPVYIQVTANYRSPESDPALDPGRLPVASISYVTVSNTGIPYLGPNPIPNCEGPAPQTTSEPDCGDSVVIGESSRRTATAAAAFGATTWPGPPPDSTHYETCAANEAWINAQIQRGAHIIDIGIDSSRQGTRSPYYVLELREIAEAGYPVDRRPWPASPSPYNPGDDGPCP